MLHVEFQPYTLQFAKPGGTSRGILTKKETRIVRIWDTTDPERVGTGECALFRGLSCDDRPEYESVLNSLTPILPPLDQLPTILKDYPSILFGLETALADLHNGGHGLIFPSEFTQGLRSIRINGLIWMGSKEEMKFQIREKLKLGFRCLKLKIGAIDFESELDLLKSIRKEFSKDIIELRVDANGAFSAAEAFAKLEMLSVFDLHSIEQPIKAGQWIEMAELCRQTPIPIALDEELIGIHNLEEKKELLQTIRPQYIILKPSLHGAFCGSSEWIHLADKLKIGWWITSALESNIGLSAIAQWCATLNNDLPQGLGTGALFTNNFETPLILKGENLSFNSVRL